jgi:geranylgeranyl reductase family protein
MTAVRASASHRFDVIVVGGGPAGATMAWVLAKQGVKVAVLERAQFPREKVCGDFVEPGGLRLLARMGVLSEIERQDRLRITKNRIYFGPKLTYKGEIRYYESQEDDIDYGLIIPRHELDTLLLEAARQASARVFSPGAAKKLARRNGLFEVEALIGDRPLILTAPLVVGADGAESLVGRSAGLRRTDRRHISVAQRVYMDGVEVDGGEVAVWFDQDIAPGYGWMFPMPGGRANVGVGLSSDISARFGVSVREAFRNAIERLRIRHSGCARARIASRPLGGVVKTYPGIDRNHFDGGVLIGDAGSFVDPITGEGITQGMESAVLAAPTLLEALDRGRFSADDLQGFERDFRRYFDPSMSFLGLSAALLSNGRLSDFWLRVGAHGHEEAARDPQFARLSGAIFGGPALQPLTASVQMWTRVLRRYAEAASHTGSPLSARFAADFAAFERGWMRSRDEGADWHVDWLKDVIARIVEVQKTIWTQPNPRPEGVFRFIGVEGQLGERPPPIPFATPDTQAMILEGVRAALDAGVTALLRRASAPAPVPAAERRRRWRIKL